ncbi:MAG: rRNA maturation RNase YbeY [Dongiaceae bacterium]
MADHVEIAVRIADRGWQQAVGGIAVRARQAALAALEAGATPAQRRRLRKSTGELALTFGDDATLRTLNSRYRGKDKPTNVLSFGSPDDWNEAEPGQPCPLGDVILARETVLREARRQGKMPADHATHLVIHGVLHLLGHDHEHRADAQRMEAIETDILARLGIADPYGLPSRRRAKD